MRYFRTANGWLADTIDPAGVPMESNEADLSAHYGVPVTGVEVDGAGADPRTGDYVPEPVRPVEDVPAPQPSLADQVADLRAQLAAVSAYAGVPVEVMTASTPMSKA